MPIMLRPKGKATKIAYSILGKPINMEKKNAIQRDIDKRIIAEETYRVR